MSGPSAVAQEAGIERLSPARAVSFDDSWYAAVDPGHFWMQWRFRVLRQVLDRLGARPARVLDVGGGHGVLRAQLEAALPCAVDIADVNAAALAACVPGRGRTLLYDATERRADLLGAYDAVLLFDVIEHVERPAALLAAAAAHLRPAGLLLVNVPALPGLYSAFDAAIGHHRRYTRASLRAAIAEALGPAEVPVLRYWGAAMLPALAARRLVLGRRPADAADRARLVRQGVSAPNRFVEAALRLMMRAETACRAAPPLGTSAMAAVRVGGAAEEAG
ncbi:MAG: methyltransferase domain-containing protein [Alphaproteobacteria bacterium]